MLCWFVTDGPSNGGCFINIPLPKAYYMSFCSEKCALWGTVSQLNCFRQFSVSPSNRGCFVNIPLPKAYYMSFCSEKCALWGTVSQLGHNPGLWPLRCNKDHDFEEYNLFSPWELVHISQTSLVMWVLEYHLLDSYDQWIIHGEQHNFGVILNPSELDHGQGDPSQY